MSNEASENRSEGTTTVRCGYYSLVCVSTEENGRKLKVEPLKIVCARGSVCVLGGTYNSHQNIIHPPPPPVHGFAL